MPERHSLAIPAHRFRQGGRDVYAFTLDLETLENVLPDRMDDKVVRDANRPPDAKPREDDPKIYSRTTRLVTRNSVARNRSGRGGI